MRAGRWLAIAILTSFAAILAVSSASGQRLEREPATVIFDYEITNDYGISFADEFERLGGAPALGYPASYRFRLSDGFTYQLTQGVLLQWRPEVRRAYLGNTFEMLEKAGVDHWLLDTKGIPLPIKEDGSGGDWNKARQTRLSWLTNEKIKAKYFANPNPDGIASWSENQAIELYGLPMSYPEKHGPFVSQRFQRVAFQLWVEEVDGMPAVGTVVRVLGGDLLKEACLVPAHALAPAERSSCATVTFSTLISIPATLPRLSLNPPPPLPQLSPPSSSPPSSSPPSSSPPSSSPPPPKPKPPDPKPPDPTPDPQPPDPPPPTSTTGPNGETIEIDGLESSLLEGDYDIFPVFSTNLDSGTTYVIRLTTSNTNVGLNTDCSDQQDDENVPTGSTSDRHYFLVNACTPPGGTVTASLVVDGSPIAAVTEYLTVEPDLRPKVALDMAFGLYYVGAGHSPSTVSATQLDSSKSYKIKLTLEDNEPAGKIGISFDSNCSRQEKVLTVPASSTSYTGGVGLQGCDATRFTLTAKLLLADDTEVVTTSTSPISVSQNVTPRLFGPNDITRGSSKKLGFTLDGLDSTKTYTVVFETSAAGIGFNSDCSDKSVTKTLSGKTYYTVTAGDFTGSDTLYGCAGAGGRVTAKVYRGGSVQPNPHRTEYHTVNVRNN